jgi:hypothetical protein
LENLKRVRGHGWTFLTQLKVNRLVDLDRGGYRAVGLLGSVAKWSDKSWVGLTVCLEGEAAP